MPEEKDKKKKIDEINIETSYIDEQTVQTGIIESDTRPVISETVVSININGKTYEFSDSWETEKPDCNWGKLRNDYKSGKSVEEIYTSLKNEVLNHKDNPEYIELVLANLMGDLVNDLYDSEKRHENIGDTAEEMLNTMLNVKDDEELRGFVCSNIHEFGMRLLNDCGINAVVLCGKARQAEAHATLLYQREDGKYVFTNYNRSMVIDAPSIKDAAKTVYKNSGLESFGYLSFIDDNGSYQEFALKDEACWGEELDKRFYNNQNLFDRHIEGKSSIDGNISYSNIGNISAEATLTRAGGSELNPRETKYSLAFKKNGESALFENSVSAGFKFERKGINKQNNGETFFETKAVLDFTQGQLGNVIFNTQNNTQNNIYNQVDTFFTENPNLLENSDLTKEEILQQLSAMLPTTLSDCTPGYKSKHFTTFVRGLLGKETNLVEKENLRLDNTAQASLTGGIDIGTSGSPAAGGDARVVLEDGIQLTNISGNTIYQNGISAGIVGDLKLTNGAQKPGIMPGGKFNVSSAFQTKPADNIVFGANANAGAVVTAPAKDFAVNGGLYASYKPNNSDIMIFGQLNSSHERQKLNIGQFKQQTENVTTLGAVLGAQINDRTTLHAGYSRTFDKLNSTRNQSVISLGAKITF